MANQSGMLKDDQKDFTSDYSAKSGTNPQNESKAMGSLLEGAQDKVRDVSNTVSDKARGVVDKVRDFASHTPENVTSMIEDYPTQSFFVGLGVGCLLGFALTSIVRK